MKFFIDTSNKKLIFAIINDQNKIIDFLMQDTNNDVVKTSVFLLKKFIKKNKLKFEDITDYMLTTGPGSFTGVKVALNIIRSINLLHPINKIHTISTFDLLEEKNSKYIAIKFGKGKYYLKEKKSILSKVKVVKNISVYSKNDIVVDYDNFSKEKLKNKIDSKAFKILDNVNKVKINYLSNF